MRMFSDSKWHFDISHVCFFIGEWHTFGYYLEEAMDYAKDIIETLPISAMMCRVYLVTPKEVDSYVKVRWHDKNGKWEEICRSYIIL